MVRWGLTLCPGTFRWCLTRAWRNQHDPYIYLDQWYPRITEKEKILLIADIFPLTRVYVSVIKTEKKKFIKPESPTTGVFIVHPKKMFARGIESPNESCKGAKELFSHRKIEIQHRGHLHGSHVIFCQGRLLKYAIAEEGVVKEWKGGEDSRKREQRAI